MKKICTSLKILQPPHQKSNGPTLTGKELFYRLNEQFIAKRAGNHFCDEISYRGAADNKHFTSDLPTRVDAQNFSKRRKKI